MNVFGTSLCNALLMAVIVCMAATSRSSARGGAAAGYDGPREALHVYLLIGQSNMAGRAPFTKEESGPVPRCYLLNDKDRWEPARNPLNRHSTIRKGLGMQKMNPGYTFAKAMLEKDDAISIGLVVNAKGGTNIRQWARGSRFYREALRRTQAAQKRGVLKGVLWHQGESDAKDAKYLDKLKALVADIRRDLKRPDLPFVAGQVNDVKLVNDQIARLPEVVPSTGFVSSDGLKAMDRWHFDAKSMRLLGRRYAEAMLKIHAARKSAKKTAPDGK
ncbi:MAG: sialate O-acetylesterase [Planctomycetota bacterium]